MGFHIFFLGRFPGRWQLWALCVRRGKQNKGRPMITEMDLFAFLDSQNIAHETARHEAIFTVEAGAQIKAKIAGGHTKNLFLKDKSGALFLVCALGDTAVPVNKLHRHLDCKRLSFGKPDLLLEALGMTPGSVTVFSILNDTAGRVTLVLDKALMDNPKVNFHPLTNTATTTIASDRLIDFARAANHEPIVIDFAALTPEQ